MQPFLIQEVAYFSKFLFQEDTSPAKRFKISYFVEHFKGAGEKEKIGRFSSENKFPKEEERFWQWIVSGKMVKTSVVKSQTSKSVPTMSQIYLQTVTHLQLKQSSEIGQDSLFPAD